MRVKRARIPVVEWRGCYDRQWCELLDDEAFEHPARFSLNLISRIYDYGFKHGWWQVGDTIGDLFGGVGCGGLVATYKELAWVGMELEQSFVEVGQRNFKRHSARWKAMGVRPPTLIAGDSRKFAQIRIDSIVTSPPHGETMQSNRSGIDYSRAKGDYPGRKITKARQMRIEKKLKQQNYGDDPANIGNLKLGKLDGIVTSGPYGEVRHDGCGIAASGQTNGHNLGRSSRSKRLDAVVMSPPWEDQESKMNAGKFADPSKFAEKMSTKGNGKVHGSTTKGRMAQFSRATGSTYGDADGQIGNMAGETYWMAMSRVYGQALVALRPGGVMCVVVKDYIKKKKRVPLCDLTMQLLLSLGFQPLLRARAMLVKEFKHPGLFGCEVIERRERKSFFRRNAERKGSPRIDWEECLVVRKPK